jgi:hypothetical protein
MTCCARGGAQRGVRPASAMRNEPGLEKSPWFEAAPKIIPRDDPSNTRFFNSLIASPSPALKESFRTPLVWPRCSRSTALVTTRASNRSSIASARCVEEGRVELLLANHHVVLADDISSLLMVDAPVHRYPLPGAGRPMRASWPPNSRRRLPRPPSRSVDTGRRVRRPRAG